MTKYCTVESYGLNGFTDGLTELEPDDDAATVNWGSNWQMPSLEQVQELIDPQFTTTVWTTINGFIGKKIISKQNDAWIFLPATGYCDGMEVYREGSYGSCWTRNLIETSPNNAYDWGYTYIDLGWGGDRRYTGLNVRPVRVEKVQRVPVTGIELSEKELSLLPEETRQLTATVLPEDAYFKGVKWESSDEMVAQVSGDGLVKAICPGSCTITCRAGDGSGVKAECQVTVAEIDFSPDDKRHLAIDLGLPSGTLWATCNIGANSPEEYGDYFAWGETEPKESNVWATYKYCKGDDKTMTKYCLQSDYGYNGYTDTLTDLLPEDDAATANWGSNWQMPSFDQIDELCNSSYTTTTWTTRNGVYGQMITSKSNGNSIFLPAAGYRNGTNVEEAGTEGYYWTRSIYKYYDNAYSIYLSSEDIFWRNGDERYCGQVIRPVRVQR